MWIALRECRNLRQTLKVLRDLIRYRKSFQGDRATVKFVRSPGGYHLGLSTPRWPSRPFFDFMRHEIRRTVNGTEQHWMLTMVFSVTSRCSLNCEHCFEWDNLSRQETLSLEELKRLLARFQENGIGQVQISGGEPLLRLEDTLELVRGAENSSEFWLLSSGIGLSMEVAEELKTAGFTGVNLSLDHWDPDKHNTFRGNSNSYQWVQTAAENVLDAGLQLALSNCVTRDFATRENLETYLDLAYRMGCGFIQLLEPRAAGRFANQDVELTQSEVDVLSQFYVEMNTYRKNRRYPMVMYPGYHQRRLGCFGAGLRFMHMDPKGNLHACPFCRKEMGHADEEDIAKLIAETRLEGCQAFEMAAGRVVVDQAIIHR